MVDQLIDTTARALAQYPSRGLVLAGGVAANRMLRRRVVELAKGLGLPSFASPPELATDNAAMIAGLGCRRLAAGDSDAWDLAARASWPLGAG